MKLPNLILLSVMTTLLLATSCTELENTSTTSATEELTIDYEKYTLENGLDVVLHKDDSDPIAAVAILFNVGSNREQPGRTGFAHFFEHMLFQNSENVGKGKFFQYIEDLGGTFNGGTWQDGTIYFEVVPKDALERILWMESDRMGFMINTVTEPVLENEKQVVKNEKRQRVDNQPYGHTNYVIDKALYPEGHPYNWQVIGSLEDLEAATIDDVKAFYDKYYGPNNATMVIAGDFDTDQVKAWVEKYFGEIPAKEKVTPIQPQSGKLESIVKLMHEDNFAQLPELRMVFPTVEDANKDRYALNYLSQILYDGKRAPLFKILVEERKLAPSPVAFNQSSNIAGKFTILARANNDVDLDSVHQAVFEAFERFEAEGIDSKDMQRIKNSLETNFYNGVNSILTKSFQLAQANEFRGSPDKVAEEVKNILAVTKADVMRVYEKYIKDKPYILTSFVPKGKAELAVTGSEIAPIVEEPIVEGAENAPLAENELEFEKTPSNIDRSVMPELGEAPTLNVPKIWTAELSNGLNVYGIENEELPLVNFSIRLKGGLTLEDPNKIGVSNLLTDIMMEGTADKTPEELEDAIGQLGANINMYTTTEYITLTGNCLARNFEAVMDLAQEVMLEPRWDEKEFDRLKQQAITQIQQQAGQPATIGSKVFNKLIYKDNILANRSSGTLESVEAITLNDLKAYYEKNFAPNISSFHISGAVSQSAVMDVLGNMEKAWSTKGVELPAPIKLEDQNKPTIYFVDIPDAKQSVIRIGKPMSSADEQNFFATTVVNERLGGGGSARLFQQLREERGYTYGAYSSLPRRYNDTYFIASSSVRSNVTKESVELFKQILDGYASDYTAEDLEKTKSSMIRSNARAFETLSSKRGILENISTYNMPMDYIEQQQELMQNMTLEQAKELIAQNINPERMIYVVVGDKATQFDKLKELGIGEVIELDKEGDLINPVLN